MPHVPGLRSPYAKVGRLVYFGRMIDKIRLHARGTLPADYINNLGKAFDARCCTFLRVNYDELTAHVLSAPGADSAVDAAAARTSCSPSASVKSASESMDHRESSKGTG